MKILDLYCGGGGAGAGYLAGGFTELVGVDKNDFRKKYPGKFIWNEIQNISIDFIRQFDFVHASPPCQLFSVTSSLTESINYNYIPYTRDLLNKSKIPYVLENVPQAPLRKDLILCGSHFDLYLRPNEGLLRHRIFEFSDIDLIPIQPKCNHYYYSISIFGDSDNQGLYSQNERRNVMRIPWLGGGTLAEAIPPAYTCYIAEYIVKKL